MDLLGDNPPPKDDPFYLEFKGVRVNYLFDGVDPGSCQSPNLTECDPEEACFVFKAEVYAICMLYF